MVVDEQLAKLLERYPDTIIETCGDGTSVVKIPSFELPEGWSKRQTTVAFIIPAGYPYAKPDCFWADGDLRLASGGTPANTAHSSHHAIPPGMLWFSYHASVWNPNADSLLTYTNVIRARLTECR
jgi:hypothetical protein